MTTGKPRHEGIRFDHGPVRLAGTLSLPANPGVYAGVVMLHGSGPADRSNLGIFPPIRDHFVAHGLAVLCYDKPGCGASTGDWRDQSYADRADEALTAIQSLQDRDDIATDSVGLWGLSQGGWIVPLAASRSDEVAFAITVSGPGVTPAEQDAYAAEHQMRAEGFSDSQIRHTLAIIYSCIDAALRGDPFTTVEPVIRSETAKAWRKYFPFDDEKMWGFAQRNAGYDPQPVLAHVRCPLYAIFGASDILVPVDKSVEVFARGLMRVREPNFRIQVFPRASHDLHVEEDGRWVQAPHYLDAMTEWIDECLDRTKAGQGPLSRTSGSVRYFNDEESRGE